MMNQNSYTLLSKQEESKSNEFSDCYCMIITRWILTLAVWGSLIWLIIIIIISDPNPDPFSNSMSIPLIVLTLSYLVYLVSNFLLLFVEYYYVVLKHIVNI